MKDLFDFAAQGELPPPVFICVPGEPVGKGRPKASSIGGFVRMYTPEKTKKYEAHIQLEAALSMGGKKPLIGPVELKLQIFMPIPESYSKKKAQLCREQRVVPTKKPDLDNVLKAVCDAFNTIVWVDDTQVVDCHVTKRFSDNPCIVAIVTPLDLTSS